MPFARWNCTIGGYPPFFVYVRVHCVLHEKWTLVFVNPLFPLHSSPLHPKQFHPVLKTGADKLSTDATIGLKQLAASPTLYRVNRMVSSYKSSARLSAGRIKTKSPNPPDLIKIARLLMSSGGTNWAENAYSLASE